jgi:hypothetical protein
MVENNVWNKGENSNYQQCVFVEENNNGTIDAGWAWNWPGLRFNVVAYPNIIYGKTPWLPTTTPKLPVRIEGINCLQADFDVIQRGSGKGNLSFDLWITDSANAEPTDITREIMIWISRDGFRPAGLRTDTLSLDGKEISFYQKENFRVSDEYEWTFLAFVFDTALTEGPVNIMELLDYLVDGGYVSPDEYLSSIQLGNEVVSGYGQTLLMNYEISFCEGQ